VPPPKLTDLETYSIYLSHNYANESNIIHVFFRNTGATVAPKGFVTKFYVDGNEVGEKAYGADLLPGNGSGVSLNYTFTTTGNHEIKAVVDTTNTISESSKEDNIFIARMNIK
jgi:subtilase family serine protease